jgi:hypothetical protein
MSTTLNRILELVINGDLPGGSNSLLKSKTSSAAIDTRIKFIAGNRFTLRLYFRKPSTSIGGAPTIYELATPNSMVLSGKKDTGNIDGDELFSILDWVKLGTGDTAYYQGILDLETAPILALFASGPDEVPVSVDIVVRDAINSERITWRAEITLCRRVYAGTGIPPSTLSASYLQSPDGSTWQVAIDDNGQASWTKVGIPQQDPAFITIQAANFVSPSGYVYEYTIDDNGQLNKRRIQ